MNKVLLIIISVLSIAFKILEHYKQRKVEFSDRGVDL